MTPAYFLAAALALAVAFPRPVAPLPDRYGEAETRREASTDDTDRQKRAYVSWTAYDGFSRWKPSPYQLSRPYVIPIYGAEGKRPIYFPPQRLNLNPGVPVKNPMPNKPFVAPSYLPPTTEKMDVFNRFNGDDDEDDRPIWGGSAPAGPAEDSKIVPTRPPRPPVKTDFPPLVHSVSNGGTNALAAESESEESAPVPRVTTARSIASGPSNCVWAIVSCCSASSNVVPASCFDQRGCPGPFWGSSPCDSDFAKAAIASALNYYTQ